MTKNLTFLLVILSFKSIAQPKFQPTEKYMYLIAKGYNLYNEKAYKASALAFDSAFISAKGLGVRRDFYHAAGSWALANNFDNAFAYLNKVTLVYKYSALSDIEASTDFKALSQDKRWPQIIKQVSDNKKDKEAKWNKYLVAELDTVLNDDQENRLKLQDTRTKYGLDSPEEMKLWELIGKQGSINLIKVKAIIKKYDWPGSPEIGDEGMDAIFYTLQHADTATLLAYLPLMRKAVKKGNARANDLATMEDRALVYQSKEQIYGSQAIRNKDNTRYIFCPIQDEPNVNKRRAAVGLEPLEDYAKLYGFVYVLSKK